MNVIVPEMNVYPDERYEALFQELFEAFDETGQPRLDGPVDALVAGEEGYGTWGVTVNEDGEMGVWMLADTGTIIFYINGNVEYIDVDLEEDYVMQPDEHLYNHAHRVMEIFIPEDAMPDRIPDDDVEQEAEELSHKPDVSDDDEPEDE